MTLNTKIGVLCIFRQFWLQRHISIANCSKITRNRLGLLAYETFSTKRSFHLLKFRPPLHLRNSPYWGIKLEYCLQNTCIRLLKRQHPRETVAPTLCKYIVPSVSQYWNSCTGYGARHHLPSSLNETSL